MYQEIFAGLHLAHRRGRCPCLSLSYAVSPQVALIALKIESSAYLSQDHVMDMKWYKIPGVPKKYTCLNSSCEGALV